MPIMNTPNNKNRIHSRSSKEFIISLYDEKKKTLGIITECSYALHKDFNQEDTKIKVSISLLISKLPENRMADKNALFTLDIIPKAMFKDKYKTVKFTDVKIDLIPILVDSEDKKQKTTEFQIPEEIEEGHRYNFIGYFYTDNIEDPMEIGKFKVNW